MKNTVMNHNKIIYILFILTCFFNSKAAQSQSIYDVDWEYSGDIELEAFGWSMCNPGDVNGDGYDDLLVAAIDHSEPIETEEEEGKLYLFYGGADGLETTPSWTYQPNDNFTICGFDVSGGDLNGDGYNDIVAGNLQWAGDQIDEGKITLWYGGPSGPGAEPDWIFEGDQDYGLMGSSVAMEGDINNDGYSELFVAAKMYDSGEMDEGKVWMFWGSPTGPVGPVWSYEPDQVTAIAGFPTNFAGDVNADGYDDVIIGVNGFTNSAVKQGMAVAFYGDPSGLSTTPDWTAYGEFKKDYFGHWVDGAGDVNGDGYDDVIVSAILYESDSVDFNEGAVYCFLGSPAGLQDEYIWKGQGNSLETNFGYCISGAGDVNGDGYDEIIVGTKYLSNPEYKEGSAHVFWGSPDGPETDYCWFAEGGQDSAYLGRHVDGDADFNGDGYSDFLAGAYRYTNILPNDGIVYAMYGGPRESDFHYSTDSICKNADNPTPVIDGWTGGTFSGSSGIVFSDIATGTIDLAASSIGLRSVSYTYEGLYCTMTSTRNIFIAPAVYADFSYPGTVIPISGPNPSPDFGPGASAGVFSASPEGLIFSSIYTGEINLPLCEPGIYTVTNTVSGLGCTSSASFVVELTAPCSEPEPPILDDVSPTTATITWPATPYADDYYVYVISSVDTLEFDHYPDTVLTLTDLEPATSYRVWIAAYCGTVLSSKSDNLDFNTLYNNLSEVSAAGILVYPVPAASTIQINYPVELAPVQFRISDLQGKILLESTQTNSGSYSISVESLPEGNYLLHIITDESRWLLQVPVMR
jgi:hypothetical protein